MEAKKSLRKSALAARRSLTVEARQKASEAIVQRLLSEEAYQRAKTVFAYAAMPEEVQLNAFLQKALEDGKLVGIPLITGKGTMEAVRLQRLEDLAPDAYGILSVAKEHRVLLDPKEINLVAVPGVAFDRSGGRLGMGAGFYDRFLSEKATIAQRIALTFECQLVEQVPVEPHDAFVDIILTEHQRIVCPNHRSKGSESFAKR